MKTNCKVDILIGNLATRWKKGKPLKDSNLTKIDFVTAMSTNLRNSNVKFGDL